MRLIVFAWVLALLLPKKKRFIFIRFHIRFFADSVFDNMLQRSDDGLEVSFQRMSSSILSAFKVRYFLRIESLVFVICFAIFSRSLISSSVLVTSMYRQQLTMLRYRKVIKSFSISPIGECTVFVKH